MSINLHYLPASAPCRSVELLAKQLDLEVNKRLCDLRKGEHLTPEYITMNPQHTIPTIQDGDFNLWESRAILGYLANKYDKTGKLYPTDPVVRAVVDQRLYFDMGTLYDRFGKCVYPLMFGKTTCVGEEEVKKLKEGLKYLDDFIGSKGYTAADHLTIADFALVATVSTIETTGLVEMSDYARVSKWLSACKSEMPSFTEINQAGVEAFNQYFKDAQAKATAS